MAIAPGVRIGTYEIDALIGEGGMGQVYRATDTSLKRAVAIKLLPESVANDPDRLSRFQREAELLARLNHPNIAQIHGLEKSDGITALVMELVEGPTLADRIAESAIPLDDAMPVATQIAQALEAAHEQGIIHRDLKPANIKVRSDGTVKVLDFGLAKALDRVATDTASASLTSSPTMTSPATMTKLGVILGTAAYMSPEQAKGKPADKRSDIWAFGCVLYEMLTGIRPFPGDDVTDTVAAIMRAEPDWSRLPPATPSSVRRLLRRSLEKDRRKRFADASDARLELEDAVVRPVDDGLVAKRNQWQPSNYWRGIAISALILLAGAITVFVTRFREQAVIPQPVQFTIEPSSGTALPTPEGRMAASPDGSRIAFALQKGSAVSLLVRDVSTGTIAPVPSSEGVTSTPFWAPDSRSIAFVVAGKLRRVDIATGLTTPICDLPAVLTSSPTASAAGGAASGTWNSAGDILFAVGSAVQGTGYPLFRVAASGGQPVPVTTLDDGREETEHALPDFLSDGQHFMFLVRRKTAPPAVVVGSLAGTERIPLLEGVTKAAFAAPDHVVYVRNSVLYQQRFDPRALKLTGDAVAVTNDVQVTGGSARGAFTVSATGLLAFENSRIANLSQFTWYDRSGRVLRTLGQPDAYANNFSVTSDGQRILFVRGGDIWSLDARLETVMKVVDNPFNGGDPVWGPDDMQFLYSSVRTGSQQSDIAMKTFTNISHEEILLSTDEQEFAEDWSPDGRYIALMHGPAANTRVAVLALADRKLTDVTSGPFKTDEPHFSPDGKFLAYNSNESGRQEIYVQPFPPTGKKWIVSTGGGVQPRWGKDGRELFYLAPNGEMMAVKLDVSSAIPQGASEPLFETGLFVIDDNRDQYDVTADGRFLVLKPVGARLPGSITVVVNAFPLPK